MKIIKIVPYIISLVILLHSTESFSQDISYSLEDAKKYYDLAEIRPSVPITGTVKTEELAYKIYLEYAEKGNADAQYVVGKKNWGLENVNVKLKWLKLAAEQGHPLAQYELSLMYYTDRGVEKNLALYIKWCNRAANQGLPKAMVESTRKEFGKNNVEIILYRQLAVILENLFIKQTDPDNWNRLKKYGRPHFMSNDYQKTYEENLKKFNLDYQNSCNDIVQYGKNIPDNLFCDTHRHAQDLMEFYFNDSFLSKEERTEVNKQLLIWEPLTEWKPSNESEMKEELELFLKITPLPGDIKADGKSTSEITAYLYEYTPGTDIPRKPLTGKTLTFEIEELDGIRPGTLSRTSAATNANGKATITYTAPTLELLQKRREMWQNVSTVKIRCEEYDIEDLAYISFQSDRGKIWANPGIGALPRTGFVPPDKRYPALITATFEDDNLESIKNTEVTFSIKESNPVGMLRSLAGREGKQITVKTDAMGFAYVQYFYAASTPPEKQITETIEAKTKNMFIPVKVSVSTGFNLVIDNAESAYDLSKEINAGDEIPLKITVRDQWNPTHDLGHMMGYWGNGDGKGNSKLYVKLEIEKQGFVPNYFSDLLETKFYPEPSFTEILRIRNLAEFNVPNLLYIPEWSLKKAGYPTVTPMFSGTNNYEIKVTMVDENGEPVFEIPHPRRRAFLSIPTGLPASTFRIFFLSNPLGPHTELARFGRLVLSTVSFGEFGPGAILSFADAATAINTGNAEELANVMLSAIKSKVLSDAAKETARYTKQFKAYNNMSMAEQFVSHALTEKSDKGLIAQMESKILSGIASAGFGDEKQMIVLEGNGNQKLLIEAGQKPKSKFGKALKDNVKISFHGMDKETKDFVNKVGEKLNGKGEEIPCLEGKFNYDDKLDVTSLKNGNVTIYTIPKDMKVTSENAVEMKIY